MKHPKIQMAILLTVAVTGALFLTSLTAGPVRQTPIAPGQAQTGQAGGHTEVPPGAPDPPADHPPESPADIPPDAPPDSPEPTSETPDPPDPGPGSETHPEPEPMASAHFALWEYACDCGGYCDGFPHAMEPELLEKVEALRQALGRPVIITSGVRCERRNDEVGGVSWSFHKRGAAADLYSPGVAVGEVAAAAQAVGLNILPHYSESYVHVEIT